MKVRTKGILLVVVPLAFQTALTLFLLIMVYQTQAQNAQIRHSFEANKTRKQLYEVMTNVITDHITIRGNEDSVQTFAAPQYGNEIIDAAEKVVHELKEDTWQQPNATRLIAAAHSLVSTLKEDTPSRTLKPSFELILTAKARDLTRALTDMNAADSQRQSAKDLEHIQHERLVWISLLSGLIVSVLLSLLLLRFSTASIVKPIKKIVKDANKMSKRLPLGPPLHGTDELADLDKTFHDIDREIAEIWGREADLVNEAADLIVSLDSNGYIHKMNNRAITLLQCQPRDAIGSSILGFVDTQDVDKLNDFISMVARKEEAREIDVIMLKGNQKLETQWSAIWSPRENSIFCVIHDASEQKQVERMKRHFIDMLSLDLQRPLMSTQRIIQEVKSVTLATQPAVIPELDGALRNLDRMLSLLTELLGSGAIEAERSGEKRAGIREAIQLACDLVQPAYDQQSVELAVSPIDAYVEMRSESLVRIILNLLANALRFARAHVSVSASVVATGPFVELTIEDDGPGVPKGDEERIFELFEQGKNDEKKKTGSGFGLAICKMIIEEAGGQCGVRTSSKLGGSCFYLKLPAAQKLQEKSEPNLAP